MSKPLLTITGAARHLGINQKTLRRWTDAGQVPCVRTIGGQRRYEPAALARFMRERGGTATNHDDDPTAADFDRELITRALWDAADLLNRILWRVGTHDDAQRTIDRLNALAQRIHDGELAA